MHRTCPACFPAKDRPLCPTFNSRVDPFRVPRTTHHRMPSFRIQAAQTTTNQRRPLRNQTPELRRSSGKRPRTREKKKKRAFTRDRQRHHMPDQRPFPRAPPRQTDRQINFTKLNSLTRVSKARTRRVDRSILPARDLNVAPF